MTTKKNTPKVYETVVILAPNLEESQVEAEIAKFKELIESRGAEVDKIELWGRRRLEYEIKRKREGIYFVAFFKLLPKDDPFTHIDRQLRLNENVLRFLTIHRDDVEKKPRKKHRRIRGAGARSTGLASAAKADGAGGAAGEEPEASESASDESNAGADSAAPEENEAPEENKAEEPAPVE